MAIGGKKGIRGLQDIRTQSGRVDRVFEPYMAYMKITCLEMEKARRGKERESAVRRVRNIDQRFKDMETEKQAVLKALGEENNSGRPGELDGGKGTVSSEKNRAGFRIKY